MMHSIDIQTEQRSELVDITERIEKIVRKSRMTDGVCRIFTPHTTAGLTINENADPSVKNDILGALCSLVPKNGDYTHTEGNSDAHIKASLVGGEKTVFVENGRLKLGTWQGIFFCEFDGPRKREVWVNTGGE